MAMPAGCKYTPKEEVLVGKVLRKRARGEPLDRAAADCIREADVYGDDPARLTTLFPPTNQGPHEWFFFSWCKVKGKRARGGGRDDRQEARRRRGRKERTVRGAGGVEIGQWRSTQAVKDVIQIDGSGCAVTIGYHQNFEYRDSKKQKSDWLMEEYGILPSSSGAEAAAKAGHDDKELVICKIYKTPAARRAEAKRPTAPAALPPPVLPRPPQPPSQPEPPQQHRPQPEPQLSPPPWSALPSLLPTSWLANLSLPPLLPTSWPEQLLPPLSPTSWPEQLLSPTSWPEQLLPPTSWPEQLLPPPSWPEQLSRPPQHEPMVPLLSAQLGMPWHDSMMAAGVRTPFRPLDRDWPDDQHDAAVYPGLYEAVAPFTSSPISEQQAVAEIGPHANHHDPLDHLATYVSGEQMPATLQITQCTTRDVSDHHTYNGNVLLPSDQQEQQHTESDASATAHAEGSTTPDDQPAAAGEEDEEEEDLRAFLQSILKEQLSASSDHVHNPDEYFDMIEDGFLFGEMPTIVDDYLMIDDFSFLDS